LLLGGRIRIRIREAYILTDPTYPDPENCFQIRLVFSYISNVTNCKKVTPLNIIRIELLAMYYT
jgi:hypothetical protein